MEAEEACHLQELDAASAVSRDVEVPYVGMQLLLEQNGMLEDGISCPGDAPAYLQICTDSIHEYHQGDVPL
eukprot:scaffold12049_cov15-Prasinocladus_malaysianus.AAC.1